ncbi:MAG: ADP-ribosylglycohydrolase family protein [bacterium]
MSRQDSERRLQDAVQALKLYGELKSENGGDVSALLAAAAEGMERLLGEARGAPEDPELHAAEPNDLPGIREARPSGPRGVDIDPGQYEDRLAGAFLGRSAGCILGSPVEGWSVDRMRAWADEDGTAFPPQDYWKSVAEPSKLRYRTIPRRNYARDRMDGIPVDDDLQYTLLGLLILEDSGPGFTTEDVARAWQTYLPFACTAEDVALTNLRRGIPALQAADPDGVAPAAQSCFMSEDREHASAGPVANPYYQWIGADIRADPWGYVAPGRLELAAELAQRDAYLSHRRNGIYGAMYFAAAIAAAFAVDDPVEALRLALTEIPEGSRLARELRWAMETAPQIRDYRDANAAVTERFPTMHHVHTINNACLTVFGIHIGGRNLSRVISETVAMGYDNDCTAATAGSIVGAVIGRQGLEPHWTAPFGNTIHSYLKGYRRFSIRDVLDRFEAQMRRVIAG